VGGLHTLGLCWKIEFLSTEKARKRFLEKKKPHFQAFPKHNFVLFYRKKVKKVHFKFFTNWIHFCLAELFMY